MSLGLLTRFGLTTGSAAPPSATVFLDTFTDTNGTFLAAHTPDTDTVGGGWVGIVSLSDAQAGDDTIDIQTNQARQEDTAFARAVYASVGTANFDVTIDWTNGGTASALVQILFRYTDLSNYWQFGMRQTSAFYAIREVNSGTITSRASGTTPVTGSGTYSMRLVANGTSLTGTVDGANTLSYGSATFNQTVQTAGFLLSGDTNARVDNFQVDSV